MEIKTNKELADAVNAAIKESGYKKIYIADQLGYQANNSPARKSIATC